MRKPNIFPIAIILTAVVGCTGCESVSAPKSDKPFTYAIGWWAYQDGLNITNLAVRVLKSDLDINNATSLVEITIAGTMQNEAGWKPYIKNIHRSEKNFGVTKNRERHLAEVELTPVIAVKPNQNYLATEVPFSIRQQVELKSLGWGGNVYTFKSGGLSKEITLQQLK